MKDIIIVCAGGFGVEVYDVIEKINEYSDKNGNGNIYNVLGFISDIDVDLESKGINHRIIGDIQNWKPQGNELYALGISTPSDKEKLVQLLKNRGANFETLISPECQIGKNVEIGEGCIMRQCSIDRGAKIGNFVNIMGSMVGHFAEIDDFSTTTGYANITNAKLGKRVFVGSHAVIMNNKKIGDDSFVAACSLVTTNVRAGKKVFGVPATVVDW